jgi:hypothetical protein
MECASIDCELLHFVPVGGPKDTAKEDVLERTFDYTTGNGGLPELPPKRVANLS